MASRVRAVFRAGFEAQWGFGAWPAASLVMHGSIAAALCLLVRDSLPPFGYAVFALSVCAGLIALPLLGELGPLLRADPASEWVEALPVRRSELRIARTLLLLLLVGALALSALLPAALLAPSGFGWTARAALVAAGLGQALFVAALLLGLQSALGERVEAALVLLQTLLVIGIVLGFVAGLRYVPELANIGSPAEAGPSLAWYPPAWFAAAVPFGPAVGAALDATAGAALEATGAPPGPPIVAGKSASALWSGAGWIATALSLAVLALCPLPKASRARRSGGVLALLLAPLRALATRAWVRRPERASFDLVYDALPLEREFVLRTYPMIGIPIAFLLAGARGESGPARDGLLAVLLFTPATFLPMLLAHVPASASHEARWILDTAPLARESIDNGALKAVALRFLAPLYTLLFLLAWWQAGPSFALRLALPGALLTMILLRQIYPTFASEPPLSVAPSQIKANIDWTGPLMGLGIGLTMIGILAFLFVKTVAAGLALSVALLAIEWAQDRKAARVAIAALALVLVAPACRALKPSTASPPVASASFRDVASASGHASPQLQSPAAVELVESAPIETSLDHPDIPNADVVWLEMIGSAQKSLDFAQFYASDQPGSRLEPIVAAIEAAAARGAKVRFLLSESFHKTYPETANRLEDSKGVEVRWLDMSSYSHGVLHAKYFLVDSREAFVGSQNFDWRSLEHIQELGVRIRSEAIASAMGAVFEMDWSRAGAERRTEAAGDGFPMTNFLFLDGDSWGIQLAFSPKEQLPKGVIWDLPKILERIDGAKTSVRVQLLTYRMTTRDGYWDEIESALRRAAARGVQVQLLLADWCKRKGTIEGLQSLEPLANVEVKLVTIPQWSGGFVPFARVVHAKYMVVDGVRAWLGTSNWERDYFYQSRNVGLLIDGGKIPRQLESFFADGWNGPYAKAVDPCATYEPPRIGE